MPPSAGAAGILETKVGMLVGNAGYMSPGEKEWPHRESLPDIFAFGVILWEMIMGGAPWRDSAVGGHARYPEIRPLTCPRACNRAPPAFLRNLQSCLEKDPRARSFFFFLVSPRSGLRIGNLLMAQCRVPAWPGRRPWQARRIRPGHPGGHRRRGASLRQRGSVGVN
ncbi:MAG: protein kinase [Holophaga sp.]|nr:protein kinase [Holophaga sp.]